MKFLMHSQHAGELNNPSSRNGIMKKKRGGGGQETGDKTLLKLKLIPVTWLLAVTV